MTQMKLEEYLNLEYPVSFQKTDLGYIAWYPDFGYGTLAIEEETLDEALKYLDLARRDLIEFFWQRGKSIPLPKEDSLASYSGKFVLRVPRAWHRDLAREAEENGVSLNSYVNSIVASRHSAGEAGILNEIRKLEEQIKSKQWVASLERSTQFWTGNKAVGESEEDFAASA